MKLNTAGMGLKFQHVDSKTAALVGDPGMIEGVHHSNVSSSQYEWCEISHKWHNDAESKEELPHCGEVQQLDALWHTVVALSPANGVQLVLFPAVQQCTQIWYDIDIYAMC